MVLRKIIEIDENKCTGCGQCVVNCPEGALEIIDGKARIVNEHFCDGLGACIGECPEGALKIVEREAASFDEHAVLAHQQVQQHQHPFDQIAEEHNVPCHCPSMRTLSWDTANPSPVFWKGQDTACQCPSAETRSWDAAGAAEVPRPANSPVASPSELRQWPVKLRLVSPDAPYFRAMNRLVVVSDCAALASPNLHAEFLHEASVVQICPKFEDAGQNTTKLSEIIRNAPHLKDIRVLEMEVPCCGHLAQMVLDAVAHAGGTHDLCVDEAVIGFKGEIKETRSYLPNEAETPQDLKI